MTILFFTRLFYPHIGGVEKHVMEIGERIVKDGHKVIVVTENYGWKDKEVVKDIETLRMEAGKDDWFKKFRIWLWMWKHRKLIEKADIVHCHDVFFWFLPFRFLYPKKPVFTTFHGYETTFPPSKKAVFIRKISEKLSQGTICVGEFIEKWYGTKPTLTTYGGVGILPIHTNITNTYQSKNRELKIIFIGRLEEDTGIEIYLEALKILKQKNIDFSFDVYGDGSLKQTAAQFGKVHGFQKDISESVQNADFVFASSYLSILETFACQILVFSVYNNDLKKDYLEMTPFHQWIIAAGSANELVEKIQYYRVHEMERKEKIMNAYEWVKNQPWEKVVDLYFELWKL